ncbi:MAG: tetratricopeptide repeat protein [Armatimonas sp.]
MADAPEVSSTSKPIKKLSRKAILGSFLALSLVIAGGYYSALSWQETRRAQTYLPELKDWVQSNPQDSRALALLATRYIEAKDYASAAQSLAKAVQAGENTPLIWLSMAASQAAAGQTELAATTLENAQKLHPGSFVAEANTRFQEVRKRSAMEQAAAILPNGPKLLEDEYARGSFLNRFSTGFLTREANKDREPLLWADALRRNGRANEAIGILQPLILKSPDSTELQLALGDALFEEKIYGKAGLAYRSVLKKEPDSLPALLGIGKVGVEKELLSLAKESLEKVTQREPNNVDAWIYLGRTYFALRMRYDLSLQAFEKAEKLAPARTDYATYYADALRAASRFADAEKLLRRRITEAPEDQRAAFLLAVVLLEFERNPAREKQAEGLLRGILALEPRAVTARTQLAQLLLETNRPEEAGPLLIDVVEADPMDAQAMRLLARAYQKIGQPEKAKKLAQEATRITAYVARVHELEDRERLNPMDVGVHEALVRAYEEGNQKDKADRQREFLKLLKQNPDEARRGVGLLQNATAGVIPERGTINDAERERSRGLKPSPTPTPASP